MVTAAAPALTFTIVLGLVCIANDLYSLVMTASIVPILTLSQNREIASGIAKALQPHRFSVNGIFAMDPYSSRDLALVLHVLEPRPLAIIMDRGYTEDEATQARAVFEEFMNATDIAGGTVVKTTNEVFDQVGREGVPSWVLKQLQGHFRR